VEVSLKGSYEGKVFDERTVTFVAGAGLAYDIPPGYVFNSLKYFILIKIFFIHIVLNEPFLGC
jgi:hypothetical protein